MFKYSQQIQANLKNDHKFLVGSNYICFLSETEEKVELIIRLYSDEGSMKNYILKGESQIVGVVDNMIMVKENYENSLVIDLYSGKEIKLGDLDKYDIKSVYEGFIYVTRLMPETNFVAHGIFDIKNKKALWFKEWDKYKISFSEIHAGKLFGPQRAIELKRYDVESGALRWTHDFSELAKFEKRGRPQLGHVHRILGIIDNQVFIALTNNYIVALSVDKGELVHQWRELPNGATWSDDNWNFIPKPELSTLLKEERKIIGMISKYFWEIDLQTNELSFYNLSNYFDSIRVDAVRGGQVTCLGDHAFFSSIFYSEDASRKLVKDYKIGAFNIKTKKVDWLYTFDFPEGVSLKSPAPVIGGNHLYVLDTTGTLHIFERV